MSVARKVEEGKPLNVELAPDIYEAVSAKAEALHVSLDEAVSTLLRLGLETQERREDRLRRLTEELQATDDPNKTDYLTDQLGRDIFGR